MIFLLNVCWLTVAVASIPWMRGYARTNIDVEMGMMCLDMRRTLDILVVEMVEAQAWYRQRVVVDQGKVLVDVLVRDVVDERRLMSST
jgi:hypothetical protein